jgi:hypothetical protein
MLNALFTVRVKEKGGDESITQKSYKYAPYPVFVGINLPGSGTKADNSIPTLTMKYRLSLLMPVVKLLTQPLR